MPVLRVRSLRFAGRVALCILIAALMLLSPRLYAASRTVVGTVTVAGSAAFTEREILSWLSLRSGSPYSPEAGEQDLRTICERYRNEGYLNARAGVSTRFTADSSQVDLVITVEERRRVILGALDFTGNAAISSNELRSIVDARPGAPLDYTQLEADIAAILARYERRGYPLARCTVDSLMLRSGDSADSVAVTLALEEGPRVSIQEVRVEGNQDTRADVILRESRIRFGDPYDAERMQAVRQRLLRLNIFASVSEPELFLRNAAGGVLIRVQEGNTNTFDGVAGYMPGSAPGESGYFTGLVSLAMRNLFGTGRKLHFRWQKEDRSSQELAVGYMEPWLFDIPLNVGMEFRQRRQDSSYVRQGGNARAEWMFSEMLAVSLIGSAEVVIPAADTAIARVPRSSTLSAGIEIVYDSRDDLYSPTSGARYRADYHYGRKSIEAGQTDGGLSGGIQRITVDLDSYLEVFSRQVVALGIHGRQVQGTGMDESEYYRFGGTNTLRGYRENQFLGSRAGWVNTEYRLSLARHSFVYAFLDAGYYFRPANQARQTGNIDAFQYGYGIGLRFDSPLGNLGVSFALGKGDSFAQGKVHFGILNDF